MKPDRSSPAETLFDDFSLNGQSTPGFAPDASSGVAPARVDSAALFQGQDVVHIVHQGAVYQLRTTRQGKLILTK
ncbi:MAG TPA: hemin uptake protein HemP [Aquabacterium sp.]|uniref:hemin uptake protein HemP n=1 Tax=Aquabacterium sp. TaxID=1872578 RepID=UPI002D84804A|nr:hemin uptake protein HemP [Aquabacterium sp.]HET6788193.1 hemin uptake protein HemP [Aquabacterium sp.]HEX5374477.1 hemin uptake protein HemP [Aquabacterium sp.]